MLDKKIVSDKIGIPLRNPNRNTKPKWKDNEKNCENKRNYKKGKIHKDRKETKANGIVNTIGRNKFSDLGYKKGRLKRYQNRVKQ